jgi:hypothetical protein
MDKKCIFSQQGSDCFIKVTNFCLNILNRSLLFADTVSLFVIQFSFFTLSRLAHVPYRKGKFLFTMLRLHLTLHLLRILAHFHGILCAYYATEGRPSAIILVFLQTEV